MIDGSGDTNSGCVTDIAMSDVSETKGADPSGGGDRKHSGGINGAFRAMLSFFTVIRMDVDEEDVHSMEENFWVAPLAGLLVGLFATLVGLVMWRFGFGPLVDSVMMLACVYLVSKFLHFDGLVDFGDAMIATGDKEKRIRALKDTAIGAGGFGVAFIVTMISISTLSSMGIAILIFFWPLEVMVKNSMVAAAAWGRPGNGMASRQVSMTRPETVVKSSILTLVLAAILSLFLGIVCKAIGFIPIFSSDLAYRCLELILLGVVVSVVSGVLMARIANNKIGFVNGDVLGATNEFSRAVMLLVMAAAGYWLGLF